MFNRKPDPVKVALDEAILEIHKEMKPLTADDEIYAKMTDRLKDLHSLKPKTEAISPNTILLVGGNLTGVLMIISFEKSHVLTSKALSWVQGLRRA